MRSHRSETLGILSANPQPAALLAAVSGFVPVAAFLAFIPGHLAPVALSLGALAGAAVAVCIALLSRAERDPRGIGAWDVAGVLAFVGFGAGMIADSADILRFFGLS